MKNWLKKISHSLQQEVPACHFCSDYVCLKLGVLLVQRLPQPLGSHLVALLGESPPVLLQTATRLPMDCSIGFPDFIRTASFALGVSGFEEESLSEEILDRELQEAAERIVEIFFQELDPVIPDSLRAAWINFRLQDGQRRLSDKAA